VAKFAPRYKPAASDGASILEGRAVQGKNCERRIIDKCDQQFCSGKELSQSVRFGMNYFIPFP
jgi:hypothetical protein